MEYQFQKFEKTNSRFENRISITKSNSIGFPREFYKENRIADFKFGVLYFDAATRALGIKFTNDPNESGRFSIIRSGEGYGGSVVATSFFKANGLKAQDFAGRYEWTKRPLRELGFDEDGNLFIIHLRGKPLAPTIEPVKPPIPIIESSGGNDLNSQM